MLPIHFPAWQSVSWRFRRPARHMLFRTIHEIALMIDRAIAPTAKAIKAPAPGAERGYDGAKKTVGRQHHIAVDTSVRLLFAHLTLANISDNAGTQVVLDALTANGPGSSRFLQTVPTIDASRWTRHGLTNTMARTLALRPSLTRRMGAHGRATGSSDGMRARNAQDRPAEQPVLRAQAIG